MQTRIPELEAADKHGRVYLCVAGAALPRDGDAADCLDVQDYSGETITLTPGVMIVFVVVDRGFAAGYAVKEQETFLLSQLSSFKNKFCL